MTSQANHLPLLSGNDMKKQKNYWINAKMIKTTKYVSNRLSWNLLFQVNIIKTN